MSERQGPSQPGGDGLNAFVQHPLTRRQVLKGAAAIAGLAALGPFAAACGGSSSTTTSPSAAASPKKGGHIRSGVSGGSAKDNLDAAVAYYSEPEIAMSWQLYDALLGFDADHKLINLLAAEWEANADATEYTVRLKPDLEFHNGKSVTADDVVFTYERLLNPKTNAAGKDLLTDLKSGNIKKVDDLTVRFTLSNPNAIFWETLAFFPNAIVPVGYSPKAGKGFIGTGPWVIESFRPGQQAVFSPNANYWGEGPYADKLTMIQFEDSTARLNALIGGTVDHIDLVEAAQADVVKANADFTLLQAKSGGFEPITMRIDQKPFDDVRVRQAFRLIADRQQMIDQALAGYGWIGNDMYAPFDPGYPKDLAQREQNLEEAKSLLKQAGYDNDLAVEFITSNAVGAGQVAAAQVFGEQAKGAGVKVTVKKLDPNAFWEGYGGYTFSQDYWGTRNYLAQTSLSMQPNAPYNECHWKDDEWQGIVDEAFKTSDEAARNALVTKAMTIEHERGGYIVWQHNTLLDAYSKKLAGVVADTWGQSACKNRYNLMYFA